MRTSFHTFGKLFLLLVFVPVFLLPPCLPKVPILVARYAGSPSLLDKVEEAVKIYQVSRGWRFSSMCCRLSPFFLTHPAPSPALQSPPSSILLFPHLHPLFSSLCSSLHPSLSPSFPLSLSLPPSIPPFSLPLSFSPPPNLTSILSYSHTHLKVIAAIYPPHPPSFPHRPPPLSVLTHSHSHFLPPLLTSIHLCSPLLTSAHPPRPTPKSWPPVACRPVF